jgi:hypothetical protein
MGSMLDSRVATIGKQLPMLDGRGGGAGDVEFEEETAREEAELERMVRVTQFICNASPFPPDVAQWTKAKLQSFTAFLAQVVGFKGFAVPRPWQKGQCGSCSASIVSCMVLSSNIEKGSICEMPAVE